MRLLLSVLAISAVVVASGCGMKKPLSSLDAQARDQMAAGNYIGAEATYRDYANRRPQSANGHFGLGRALSAQGRHIEASSEFGLAHNIEQTNEEYLDAYCQSLLNAERYDDLFRILKKEANQNGRPEDYLRLARFAEEAGTAEEALDALTTWARVDKGRSVEPQLALAHFYHRLGDTEMESMRLRAVLYLNPKHAEAIARLRELGEVPGQTLAIQPPEQTQP